MGELQRENGSQEPSARTASEPQAPKPRWMVAALGVYLLVPAIVLIALFLGLWPEPQTSANLEASQRTAMTGCQFLALTLSRDTRLLLLAVVAGALGSHVHLATSFATYVGERRILRSWIWWYLLRPFIGPVLALVVFLAYRAGLETSSEIASPNSYAVTAVSSLAGMFSKQATDKLADLLDVLFAHRKKSDLMHDRTGPNQAQ